MLRQARAFFDSRGYLEVQTPSLSRNTASDPFLSSFEVPGAGGTRYLQTSPEFHMKRLLAAIPRSIYQICPAFRRGEAGGWHNPEFTILEWYAPGTSATDMAQLTCELIDELHQPGKVRWTSFNQLIWDTQGLDIAERDQETLIRAARSVAGHADECDALDCLYERALSTLSGRVLVHGFPASLASLAAFRADGAADRFEVVIDGMELANGCQELLDADEFRRRAARDNAVRRDKGLPPVERDSRLESALLSGLAPVSGVALGLDRLLMLRLSRQNLCEVLTFGGELA